MIYVTIFALGTLIGAVAHEFDIIWNCRRRGTSGCSGWFAEFSVRRERLRS